MEHAYLLLPGAVALAVTLAATPLLIRKLKQIKAGQSIREEGPQSHMAKAGTPTMGGLAILFGVVAACLIAGPVNADMIVMILCFLVFGALGFLDDFIKVAMKRNLGLTAWQKLAIQCLFAAILAFYQAKTSVFGTTLFIPFADFYWDMGWAYVPFVAFVVVAMTNAVNLTDGLDGLAGGSTFIVALTLALIGGAFEMRTPAVFCAALAGGCLGFLAFNKHPAKVFMGDTGSLALGGGLAAAAILMNTELILPIAGGLYVAEAVSVILQVLYFKATKGKRLFKMAPLHHHFELCGWKETKVVAVFWLATVVLCVIAILAV